MAFIELTSALTGRTFYVRAEQIAYIGDYANDDEGKRYTCVLIADGTTELLVKETKEHVLRHVFPADTPTEFNVFSRFIARYGVEDGIKRYQAGEAEPP